VLDVFAFEVLDVPHPAAAAITAALVSAINTLRIAMTRPFSVRGCGSNGSTAIGSDASGAVHVKVGADALVDSWWAGARQGNRSSACLQQGVGSVLRLARSA
jgi:hypothetical protein